MHFKCQPGLFESLVVCEWPSMKLKIWYAYLKNRAKYSILLWHRAT